MKTMHHIEEGNTYWLYDHTENRWVGYFENKKTLFSWYQSISGNQNHYEIFIGFCIGLNAFCQSQRQT